MKIDIFNHIFPKTYFDKMMEVAPKQKDIGKRVRAVPVLFDLDERFRCMDQFEDYAQIICLAAPPLESIAGPDVTPDLARSANDGMAEYVVKYPDRFFGFMNDDFNTSGAISVLFDIVRDITSSGKTFVAWESDPLIFAERLFHLLGEEILGLQFEEMAGGELEGDLMDLLIQLRQKYRNRTDWESADEIRDQLAKLGILLEDSEDGTKWIKK